MVKLRWLERLIGAGRSANGTQPLQPFFIIATQRPSPKCGKVIARLRLGHDQSLMIVKTFKDTISVADDVKNRRLLGQIDYPQDSLIHFEYVSHVVTELKMGGNVSVASIGNDLWILGTVELEDK